MGMLKRLKRQFLHRPSSPTVTPDSPQTLPFGICPAPLPSSNLSPLPQPTPRSAVSNVWEGTKTMLRLVKESTDAFPPLKSTAAGLIGLIDLIEVDFSFFMLNITT
jgi:hypothetical protein